MISNRTKLTKRDYGRTTSTTTDESKIVRSGKYGSLANSEKGENQSQQQHIVEQRNDSFDKNDNNNMKEYTSSNERQSLLKISSSSHQQEENESETSESSFSSNTNKGNDHNNNRRYRGRRRRNIWSSFVIIISGVLVFIVVCGFCYVKFSKSSNNRWWNTTTATTTTSSTRGRLNRNNNNNNSNIKSYTYDDIIDSLVFDYIVVGGGPSGIIAATRLAKRLLKETPTNPGIVLLLESGTDSQSSVLQSLKHHQQYQIQQYEQQQQQEQQTQAQQEAAQRQQQQTSFSPPVPDPTGMMLNLNQYDVPIMWSSIASQGSQINEEYSPFSSSFNGTNNNGGSLLLEEQQTEKQQLLSRHWPVKNLLLARGLGGCGLHNAMIYVRALPSDFNNEWNCTGWEWDQVLPYYKELERYDDTKWNNTHTFEEFDKTTTNTPSTLYEISSSSSRSWWRGTDGPITTVPAGPSIDDVAPLFIQSSINAGLPIASSSSSLLSSSRTTNAIIGGFNDPNVTNRIGVGYYEYNIKNGIRDSIAKTMLTRSTTTSTTSSSTNDNNDNNDHNDDSSTIPKNLYIRTGATVIKVLTTTSNNNRKRTRGRRKITTTAKQQEEQRQQPHAFGVKYFTIDKDGDNRGQVRTATVKRRRVNDNNDNNNNNDSMNGINGEIILATGAIMTPQILYNSGIYKNGSVSNVSGVGHNLQDHPVVPIAFRITSTLAQKSRSIFSIADEINDYTTSVVQLDNLEKEQQQQNQQQKERISTYSNTTTTMNDNVSSSSSSSLKPENNNNGDDTAMIQDIVSHLGTMGTAGFSAGAFLRSPWASSSSTGTDENDNDDTSPPPPPPDIQLTVFPRVIEPHVVAQLKKKNNKAYSMGGDHYPIESTAMLITVALLRPEARFVVVPSSQSKKNNIDLMIETTSQKLGATRTKTASTTNDSSDNDNGMKRKITSFNYSLPSLALPTNKTTYLSDLDMKRLAWGIEEVRRIRSFEPLINNTVEELSPGPQVVDQVLNDYVRQHHLTNSHWVGSTKMGPLDTDDMAVVDEQLRVRGVSNLRIVDAGVIPRIPNGNTHSTICVLACRGADLIFEDRNKTKQSKHSV